MYANSSAIIRPDLCALLEQAQGADSKFIASRILPPKFVKRPNGQYYFADLQNSGLLEADLGNSTLRAPKSAYKQTDRTITNKAFQCLDRGLEEIVDDSDAATFAPSFDSEAFSSKLLLRNMSMSYESRVAAKIFSEATFGTAATASAAYTEANLATIDFASDLLAALLKVDKRGEVPNTVVFSGDVWERVRRTTLLRKYLYGDLGGNKLVTLKTLQDAFSDNYNIEFIVANATYSTAKKGKAVSDANISQIWGDSYIWVGRTDKTGDRTAPTVGDGAAAKVTLPDGVGSTFVWEEQANSLFVTETYRNEAIRSDVVRVRQFTDENVCNANAGTLIATQYA